MIIVDTGIWVDNFKVVDRHLESLGEALEALVHPYVIGELALGSLTKRTLFLRRMERMPQPPMARHEHVMQLIAAHQLHATGIGYVDAHLLASVKLLPGAHLWTRDKRLGRQAERLGVAYTPA